MEFTARQINMKKILLAIVLSSLFFSANSQKKDFEGRITYKVVVSSKTKNYEDNFYKLLFAANGDKLIVDMRNGNIKQALGLYEAWYIGRSKRCYVKFRNIDTLYFREYSSDTSGVTGVAKSDSGSVLAGFSCKSITLKKSSSSVLFLYTDSLQQNTEYEKDNTIDNSNVLIREIGTAIWLYSKTDYPGASITDSCLRVDQKSVDDHIFDLPVLPQKNVLDAVLIHKAKFRGGDIAWERYLKNNLDASVSTRYIKIPKGQDNVSVKVIVLFVVSEDGSISDITVTNKSEVDSHLANEAMRVIRESPVWEAATVYGVKTKMPAIQPVNFMLTK
jgi:hypothetical protein